MALEYEFFIDKISIKVGERVGNGCEVSFGKSKKVNEGEADTLIIKQKEDGDKIGLSLSLKGLFEEYQDGKGMDEIVVEIAAAYMENIVNAKRIVQEMQKLGSYESCKEKIYFRLVSTERNQHLLGEVPHFEMMDLSMLFYVFIDEEEDKIGGVMLRNSLLSAWGITPEDVWRQAVKNTPMLFPERKVRFFPLVKEIKQMAKDGEYSVWQNVAWEGEREPLILTNQKGINGFSVVLYSGLLQEISNRMGRDLYILPSSLHEGLIFPVDCGMEEAELQDMVKEVNRTVVRREDLLSDSLYYYGRKDGGLKKIR